MLLGNICSTLMGWSSRLVPLRSIITSVCVLLWAWSPLDWSVSNQRKLVDLYNTMFSQNVSETPWRPVVLSKTFHSFSSLYSRFRALLVGVRHNFHEMGSIYCSASVIFGCAGSCLCGALPVWFWVSCWTFSREHKQTTHWTHLS